MTTAPAPTTVSCPMVTPGRTITPPPSHTLSAIASLHTEAPDLEGRYRIAEEAIFAVLERTARPSAAELAAPQTRTNGVAPLSDPIETSLGRDEYIRAVEVAKDAIASGEAIQVVLARRQSFGLPTDPSTGQMLNGIGLYRSLRRVNPSPYLFFVRTPQFEVVGASPELLVKSEAGRIITHPIAGTIKRGNTPEEDERLADELRRSLKDRAEHVMLVDLARNDVNRVADPLTVKVDHLMVVEKFSHVQHLVTSLRARLRDDRDRFDALAACFPAGTVSGAPKVRAMQLIAGLEPEPRGVYAGAVLYADYADNLDSCIAIRTIVLRNSTAEAQAGAGVVADSVPAREYEETVNKARALLGAIEMAERGL